MESFNYYKIKTIQESSDIFRFYFNINHGEPTNCLIVEIDKTNPKFEYFSNLDYLKYNKIILEESAFYLEEGGDLVSMVKVLLDNSQELWVRDINIQIVQQN